MTPYRSDATCPTCRRQKIPCFGACRTSARTTPTPRADGNGRTWLGIGATVALAALVTLLWAAGAFAQERCLEYGKQSTLLKSMGMVRLGWGQAQTQWLEIWVNIGDGRWVASGVSADGKQSCIKGDGVDWHFDAPPKQGDPL